MEKIGLIAGNGKFPLILAENAEREGAQVIAVALSEEADPSIARGGLIDEAALVAAQLGAHVIKVKPPKDFIEQAEAKKVFEKYQIPTKTLADRVRHVVQSAFNGKRIVIFSGGEAKGTEDVLAEIRGLKEGGSFGSIMGRNAFQRPKADAVKLLNDIQDIYAKAK